MDYKVKNGLLYENNGKNDWEQVDFYPTPNKSGNITPRFLVIHFTAGSLDARGTATYFQKPSAKTSAHLTMDLNGKIVQSVELNVKAWHAGKSQWADEVGLNNTSIGIEVVNPGPLTKTSDGQWKTWWGHLISGDEARDIIESPHPNNPNGPVYGWVPFTKQQINSLIAVGQELMTSFGLDECVGHDMISPGRKTDPGPCMDTRVYDQINRSRSDGAGDFEWQVNATILNGRAGPSTSYDIIKELAKGETVEILNRQGHWWFVDTEDGKDVWVHSKFLRLNRVEYD